MAVAVKKEGVGLAKAESRALHGNISVANGDIGTYLLKIMDNKGVLPRRLYFVSSTFY
jgi:hypothetical protein